MSSKQPPTAIVLSLSGISAQHLPTYGNNWIETPNINRLANQSEIFEFSFADQAANALPRRLIPVSHSVAKPETSGLLRFSKLGLESVLVTDCPEWIHPDSVEPFSTVLELSLDPPQRLAESFEQTLLARSFAQLVAEIDSVLESAPALVWIELDGMRSFWDAPYAMREEFVEEDDPDPPYFFEAPRFQLDQASDVDPDLLLGIQQAFAAQMAVFDLCLGALLDHLDLENRDSLIFGLTSDQGYPLGEHHVVGNECPILFSESTHIPWLIHDSRLPKTAVRHPSLCYGFDVENRLLDSLVDRSEGSLDSSELPMIGEQLLRSALLTCSDRQQAIRTPAWLSVSGDNYDALFVKPDDRWEVNDVSSRRHDVQDMLASAKSAIEKGLREGLPADELDAALTETWGR